MRIKIAAISMDLAPSGTLRASINLGNPVLAQGTAAEPTGVTVDIAHEVGTRLGVPVEFVCFDAARKSYDAMATGTSATRKPEAVQFLLELVEELKANGFVERLFAVRISPMRRWPHRARQAAESGCGAPVDREMSIRMHAGGRCQDRAL